MLLMEKMAFVSIFLFPSQEIDDFHQYASFKYIKWKPVRDLQGDQFLRMCQAEKEKLITMKIGMDMETNAG